MADARYKDENWRLPTNMDNTVATPQCQLAVLMDIRDELQTLNRVFACHNFLEIPHLLRTIRRNTMKRKRKNK